ncbi:MAG: mannose-6-phosphate isomerase, class I, partial [Bacteroidetes bacterium]|nr:mannose-6-phosphate isomerase, class I [Bacteroidota bacterium]
HPNKRQARVLHKRDPVNYPDENHKPEIAVAIDKLEALVGFRPLQEILDEINSSKALQLFFNNALNLELNSRETSIKILYEAALDNYFKKSSSFNELIDNLNKELLSKGNEISDREKLFVEMFSKYNYDVGLISIFFLNLIHLEKGEGVFLDAGIPHAYLKGNIVECMANSDNVVRAGLTPKFTDIESLKEIINFDSQELLKFHFEDNSMGRKYNAPVEEFAIEKVMLKNGNTRQIISNDKPSVILVIEGEGHIFFNENQKVIMTKGESFLLPAVLTKTNIEAITTLEFFHSTVP